MSAPASELGLRTRLALFLYSSRNLAGCACGLAGLALHWSGLVQHYWLAIVAGLYAIGYLAMPENRGYVLSLGSELAADAIGARLADLVKSISRSVEPDVIERVQHIQESIVTLLPRLMAREQVGDRSLYTVRQTALQYLPATLQSYVNMPVAFRRLHAVRDGKTPKALLLEQLDLLDTKLKEIVTSVAENDAQALLVNGRFLEEKFGKRDFLLA